MRKAWNPGELSIKQATIEKIVVEDGEVKGFDNPGTYEQRRSS